MDILGLAWDTFRAVAIAFPILVFVFYQMGVTIKYLEKESYFGSFKEEGFDLNTDKVIDYFWKYFFGVLLIFLFLLVWTFVSGVESEKLNQLEKGMSEDQIVKVIGSPIRVYRWGDGNHHVHHVYREKYEVFSKTNIYFERDSLTSIQR